MEEVPEALQRLVRALERANVKYVVVGGVVAVHYGRVRTTQDLDVVVDAEEVNSLAVELEREGFEFSRRDLEEAFRERGRVTLYLPGSVLFHVDLKFARDRLDYEVLKGRVRGELFGVECWVESVEDVVVAKLVYGGAQDEEDVVAILMNKGISDRMKEKAGEFGVLDRLCGIAEMLGLRC